MIHIWDVKLLGGGGGVAALFYPQVCWILFRPSAANNTKHHRDFGWSQRGHRLGFQQREQEIPGWRFLEPKWFTSWLLWNPLVGGHQQPLKGSRFSPSQKGHQQNSHVFFPLNNDDTNRFAKCIYFVKKLVGSPASTNSPHVMVLSPYVLRTWPWHESGGGSTPTGEWRTHPVIQSGNGDVVWFKLPVFRYQTLDMGRIMRKPWSMPVKGQDGGLFLGWVLGGVGIDSHQKTAVIWLYSL